MALQLALLALTQAVLVLQVLIARRSGGALGLLLIAQAVFWTLGFVVRPAFMVIAQPTERDLLADPRLALSGYASSTTEVIGVALAGFVAYLASLAVLIRVLPDHKNHPSFDSPTRQDSRALILLSGIVLWATGWVGRAALLTGAGGILQQLQPMAVTGSVLIILGLSRRKSHNLGVLVVMLCEVLWSFSFESKAALIIPALALLLRWTLQERTSLLQKYAPLIAIGIACGFFAIQSARGILTGEDVTAIQGAVGGGVAVAYLVGLLQRFDGFSSVTDAVFLNGTAWQSSGEYLGRLVTNLIPKFGAEQVATNGQIWTREVRTYSVPNQFLDVPIAAGPTAEGFAMWGVSGVIFLNAVMALLIILLARLIQSGNVFGVILGVSMTFNTGFFEIGLQGWTGQLNKSIQALIVATPFILNLWLAQGIARQQNAPSSNDDRQAAVARSSKGSS
ncbi:hypothetical protein RWH43_08875 [Microbacterium sp. KSW2-21]|uniref:O-antigen polysaccharide polymerase Wzy n=1 Tax=Microbacterium algihabitans TaxID=3075992 RepID=A0ABU3RVE7_9MICO|nr:hypothetical protein [Microbacterium sp. KSW2-21]MDU0326865.1 hypothetical protein [Microbacterium sp. KSW2-21]